MVNGLLVALGLAVGGAAGLAEVPGAALLRVAGAALVAEDQTVTGRFLTATEVKPILTATKESWIAIREWDGRDLVYVTQVWSWRCGLLQMEVSVNGGAAEVWDLPPCHAESAQPAAILDSDGQPFRDFDLGSVQQVTVTLTYDDLTTDSATFQRRDVLMP